MFNEIYIDIFWYEFVTIIFEMLYIFNNIVYRDNIVFYHLASVRNIGCSDTPYCRQTSLWKHLGFIMYEGCIVYFFIQRGDRTNRWCTRGQSQTWFATGAMKQIEFNFYTIIDNKIILIDISRYLENLILWQTFLEFSTSDIAKWIWNWNKGNTYTLSTGPGESISISYHKNAAHVTQNVYYFRVIRVILRSIRIFYHTKYNKIKPL